MGETIYRIDVTQVDGEHAVGEVRIDGVLQTQDGVLLVDDGQPHRVDVRLQRPAAPGDAQGDRAPDAPLPG